MSNALEALRAAVAEITAHQRPDDPMALWVVDRPRAFYQLTRTFDRWAENVPKSIVAPAVERGAGYRNYAGLQVYQWNSQIATPEEWERAPEVCRTPGVWVQLRSGDWREISEQEPYP